MQKVVGSNPMEILGGLISTWLPVEKTSIRASKDGDIITATIGSVGHGGETERGLE